MKEWNIDILTKSEDLPDILQEDFFHSNRLFLIYEQTPRLKPYMVTAKDEEGKVVACMLAVVRARSTWIPPFIYWHCRIFGEGDYSKLLSKADKEEIFGCMISAITKKMGLMVFYIEMSNLTNKMFGYKWFRRCGYIPVPWMSIHNSLHSKSPEERISHKLSLRLTKSAQKGVRTEEIKSDDDIRQFIRLLHKHNLLKPKRYIPADRFFHEVAKTDNCHMLLTKYRSKAIGCAALVYSQGNAYLWYSAFLRKSYMPLHPDDATLWNAIQKAYHDGCQHIVFIDVGLPFRRNSLRELILRFGGKPVSTFRWFRFTNRWLNRILSWLYRA
ncbi:MAG: GNAT family N-acetyltransferase [Prevotella sp.]|nr:GNAT family N-acetyltransferase [Prevotella sp.]